jgi:hypothetical protein
LTQGRAAGVFVLVASELVRARNISDGALLEQAGTRLIQPRQRGEVVVPKGRVETLVRGEPYDDFGGRRDRVCQQLARVLVVAAAELDFDDDPAAEFVTGDDVQAQSADPALKAGDVSVLHLPADSNFTADELQSPHPQALPEHVELGDQPGGQIALACP